MNKISSKRIVFATVMGIVLVGLGITAFSGFYSGNNLPITVTNNDNNTSYNAQLVAFGDTNGSCVDSDTGAKPAVSGLTLWVDGNSSYSYQDFCDSNSTLIELACAQHVRVNGVQYANFVGAVRMDCNASGFSICNPIARRCV